MTTLNAAEARALVSRLLSSTQRTPRVVRVREGRKPPMLVVIGREEDLRSLADTIEVMTDPKAMADMRQSRDDFERGEYTLLDDLK